MADHIVSAFTDELDRLSADILRMGGIVEQMIADAASAVLHNDVQLAGDVIERDHQVDQIEGDVERQIVSLIARRQPMAHDLRSVFAALKVSGELERVGDLSKNMSKRALGLEAAVFPAMRSGVARMAQPVARQLHLVLDAYASGNAAAAKAVWESDDEIDQHYNALFREMLTYMIEDPRSISDGAHMLFMAKNLERIGDHCTNIAEFVYFQVTGEHLVQQDRPKY
ncbi:MAG TPA: phosphate signaling complex protein PhoU [Hyphomonas sp.]|nr:phosphate signaling complex protein PhoU [Hyphomonas sp.]MCB9971673.1 phosphate signaling complex protein PhoU [Hyphomonas sp.]HPE49815.1 phosphate signaling complex protein PhoU [Hyphomonas sp.]